MARAYITTATTVQVESDRVSKCLIQVNAALTGTITVVDGTGSSTNTIAIITNPTVGSQYEYWNFSSGVKVTTDASCNITVCTSGGRTI